MMMLIASNLQTNIVELNGEQNVSVNKNETKDLSNVVTDNSLKEVLNNELGRSADENISATDMASFTGRLFISHRYNTLYTEPIQSLEGIQYAVNITMLGAPIEDISYVPSLENITNLNEIQIYNNNLRNIDFLKNNTNLKELDIGLNHITDLSPLEGLVNLVDLRIGDNYGITDLSPLSNLTNLENLEIGTNGSVHIADISPLSSLTKLTHLKLYSTTLEDLSPLSTLVNLEKLEIGGNGGSEVSDISVLENLKKLNSFWFNNSRIYDLSILPESTFVYGYQQEAIYPELTVNEGESLTIDNPVKAQNGRIVPVTSQSDVIYNEVDNTITFENVMTDINRTLEFSDPLNSNYYGEISFNIKVVPNESPQIYGTKDQTIKVNESLDLLNGVTATDKEDGDLTSSIVVDDSKLDITSPGEYEVTYSVTDSYGNNTTEIITVKVLSNESPQIEGVKDQTTKVNKSLDLLNGVTATDKEDGDLTSSIVVDDSTLDITIPGEYEVTYSVSDSDGNNTMEIITVEVLSNESPQIEGAKDQTIKVNESLNLLNGVTAADKEDGDLTGSIVVDDSKLDITSPGKYEVTYSVTDSDGNATTERIIVTVVSTSNEKPVISGLENQTININETIDLLDGITATDKEDGDLTNNIVVDDSKMDLSKVGNYEVSYSVTDSDGNTTTEKIIVNVESSSNENPIINGLENQTINVNETIDLLDGITATDKEDGDLTNNIVVDDSKLDVSKVGEYEVTYSITDSNGNTTTERIIVTVELQDKPVIVDPEKPEEVDPEKPEVIDPEKPEVVDPEKPAVVDPEKPEVIDPEKPEVIDPEKPKVIDPEKTEIGYSQIGKEDTEVLLEKTDELKNENNDKSPLKTTGNIVPMNLMISGILFLILTLWVRKINK